MTLSKAFKRLQWRFQNFKTFNVNKTDIEALNTCTEWTNSQQKQTWKNNQVAAKLFINELIEQQKRYDCSVLDNTPHKEINRFLEKPLDWHLQRYSDYLNQREVDVVLKEIETRGVINITNEESTKFSNELAEAGNTFGKEDVEEFLLQIVTEALRKFS